MGSVEKPFPFCYTVSMILRDDVQLLMDQDVEVMYNGILYKGVLAGTSEDTIEIMTSAEWLSLPMVGVASVKKSSGRKTLLRDPFEGKV